MYSRLLLFSALLLTACQQKSNDLEATRQMDSLKLKIAELENSNTAKEELERQHKNNKRDMEIAQEEAEANEWKEIRRNESANINKSINWHLRVKDVRSDGRLWCWLVGNMNCEVTVAPPGYDKFIEEDKILVTGTVMGVTTENEIVINATKIVNLGIE
jgi:hypothetical protein